MTHRTLARALAQVLGAVPSAWLLAVLCVWSAAGVRADEVTGTWTGEVEGRGNYFWERSTRVMMPAVRAQVVAPNGVRVGMNYLVDVIASASVAQTGGGSDAVLHELRHAVGVRAGKLFTLGDNELDLSAHGTYSIENDYKSWLYGVRGAFSWNEKNSTLLLGITRVDDTVLSNADPSFRGRLYGLTTSLGFSQLLSPTLVFGLGYQFVYLEGYLGNPYRRALIGPLPHREDPPNDRYRNNAQALLAWYLPSTWTTLQAYLRLYRDSWAISAITPELRIYQQLSRALNMRLRYRFYDQTRADFALESGQTRYPVGYTGPITNDPKMEQFHSHQFGLRLELALMFLHGTFLGFTERGFLDVSFDYQICTSRFGNNIIGTLGGQLPFD